MLAPTISSLRSDAAIPVGIPSPPTAAVSADSLPAPLLDSRTRFVPTASSIPLAVRDTSAAPSSTRPAPPSPPANILAASSSDPSAPPQHPPAAQFLPSTPHAPPHGNRSAPPLPAPFVSTPATFATRSR